MQNKRLAEPLILLFLVGVAVAWWQHGVLPQEAPPAEVSESLPAPDVEETRAKWQADFNEAQRLLASNRLSEAEPLLVRALDLAKTLPAHDKAVAETLDDMGQLYYRLGRFEECELAQGQAVAALALAEGLKAAELRLYITRHNLARNELEIAEHAPEPAQFILDYPPYTGERLNLELAALLDSDLDQASRQKLSLLDGAIRAR